MGYYSLSGRAQYDIVGIYKYGIKFFGIEQAADYLNQLETFLEELADRKELARDASPIANALKFYNFKAHFIYYSYAKDGEIYIVRVLGKRMNFKEHL